MKLFITIPVSLIILTIAVVLGASSIREFFKVHDYPEKILSEKSPFEYDSDKKTVVIIADHKVTEIFDLMAPYYLFSSTEQTNTYIISKNERPIYLYKGLFIMPHISFEEFDKKNIPVDAIVIPNLSAMKPKDQDPLIIKWIQDHYSESTSILSICAGASTAAATGLFDGKPLTTHTMEHSGIKKKYPKPKWVSSVKTTKFDNLYSTAGVSNAVDGTILLMEQMFDKKTVNRVKKEINYFNDVDKNDHRSISLSFKQNMSILKKSLFGNNVDISILLENGIDEFQLAAILDTYNRTFPSSIHSFSLDDKSVLSKYNLKIIPTQYEKNVSRGEIHFLGSNGSLELSNTRFEKLVKVFYDDMDKYIIDYCLDRIEKEHGEKFRQIVATTLDYNE